uniref:SAM domain-containing protein n=1 Tax=Parascaris univalens TaxID=6257 RepID=A0A915CF75_PARUN
MQPKNRCMRYTMDNKYSSYAHSASGFLGSQKAATLPAMGMCSASGGLPFPFASLQRDCVRQNCYFSSPCVPNISVPVDVQKVSSFTEPVSVVDADSRSRNVWLLNEGLQGGERQNERVSPACIVSAQALASDSTLETQQPQITTANFSALPTTTLERSSPKCSSSPRSTSTSTHLTMVLSQHSPVAAKPIYYDGLSNQKTFGGAYKSVQTLLSKPPPARHRAPSTYGAMSFGSGQPYVENASMKQMRNMYPIEAKNGMKDVPMWLKSLRLHKYTQMLQQMGYDEMMALDERKLEALNVTKGARKKIMQSIQKLRERVPMLKQMEKSIEQRGGDVACVIVELRGTMNTPIRSFPPPGALPGQYTQARIDGIGYTADELDDENLPGHITRILGKVHDAVIESRERIMPLLEDEYYGWLLQTYDRIINHEAFTVTQKQRVAGWKRAMRKVCSPPVGRKGTRLPHASVLLASGSTPAANQQSPQCLASSSIGSRMGGTSTPNIAHAISQTALQNALASLLHACSSSRVPLSSQAAAYYLGIASVTSLLSSPELMKQLQDLMAPGNAPSPQFQQQLHQQLLATALAQSTQQQSANVINSSFMAPQKPVNGVASPTTFTVTPEQPFANLPIRPQQQSCPQLPQSNIWKNFTQQEPQPPFGLVENSQALTTSSCSTYSLSEVMSPPVPDSSIASCLATSTSAVTQNASSIAAHSLYSPTVELRPCCAAMANSGSSCAPSTVSPIESIQQRLPPHTSPFPSPPAQPTGGHRRSSSNTSSIVSGFCSSWTNVEQTQKPGAVGRCLFDSVTLPLTHMNSMPSMQSAVQQQRRLSNQESSLFGAARPACASSVSPSSRLGSTSSSSGYSSSASDRSSGAGSPPGLTVYNFASEHASGELDNMCRDVAALNFKADSQFLHMNLPSNGMGVLP